MSQYTISIVTPSYNQGKFIERTIHSVINQRIHGVEYIVADGGSTDETLTVLKKYDQDIRWLSEKDNGQAHAVNKGFKMASGEIIGWLNSDDVYYPGCLKKVLNYFAEHPDVDVIYGRSYQIDENGDVIELYPTESWDIDRLKLHCFISQPATFIRRRVLKHHGLLDESLNFCMDYEYWLRLALNGAKFAYLPDVLAGTRIYPDTKSSRYLVEAHFEAINMLQKTLGHIPSDWIVNYSTAKAKVECNKSFPSVRFIADAWLNLWNTAGLHNQGFPRVAVWLLAQRAMMRKFIAKTFVRDGVSE